MIPVIDFINENLKPGSDSWVLACKQVRYGLEEYGCFEVNYHKVPIQLHNSVFLAAKELFDLPIETKKQKTSDRPGSNYVGQNPYLPLYESLGFDNPASFDAAESFTRIMWPQGNDHFRYGLVYVLSINFVNLNLNISSKCCLINSFSFFFLFELVKVFVLSQSQWQNCMN